MAPRIQPTPPDATLPESRSTPDPATGWYVLIEPVDRAPDAFRRRWEEAQSLTAAGTFDEAFGLVEELQAWFDRHELEIEDARLRNELRYRLRAAALALGPQLSNGQRAVEASERVRELRAVLVEAQAVATQLVCAYEIAHALERAQDFKKARFYAEVALRAAKTSGRPGWTAVVHNLLGNIAAGDYRLEEAAGHYRACLGRPLDSPLWVAQARSNLSYVLAASADPDAAGDQSLLEARRLLASALWTLRHVEGPARLSAALDAAFLWCRCARHDLALRHALSARRMAEDQNDSGALRNAYLLVAEAAKRDGKTLIARRAATRLAEMSGHPDMADHLLGVDLLVTVNLRAQ